MLRQGEILWGIMMEIAMRMPDLGTVDDTIKVIKWLVAIGQPIHRGQPVVEVETDKSILEVESTVTGVLQAIEVSAGNEAAAGQVLATFVVSGDQPSDSAVREFSKPRLNRPGTRRNPPIRRRLASRMPASECLSSRKIARLMWNMPRSQLPPVTRVSFF